MTMPFAGMGTRRCRDVMPALLLSVLLWSGCTHLEPPPALSYDAESKPILLCRYWPYGACQSRSGAAPIPDYHGWTGERMDRDLRRLREAGFDVVLISFRLEDAADPFKRERARLFLDRMSQSAAPLQAAFMLGGGSDGDADREAAAQFVRWYVSQRVGALRASFRVDGKALLVLASDLAASTVMHPALTIRQTAGSGARWTWLPPGAAVSGSSLSPDDQIVVRAGTAPRGSVGGRDEDWPLPRRRGKTLLSGLRAAFAIKGRLICVESWNDYETGSFLEPNTMDGTRVLDSFRQEILRLRRHLALPR